MSCHTLAAPVPETEHPCQVLVCTPVMLALRRLRREDGGHEFEASRSYIARPCLNPDQSTKRRKHATNTGPLPSFYPAGDLQKGAARKTYFRDRGEKSFPLKTRELRCSSCFLLPLVVSRTRARFLDPLWSLWTWPIYSGELGGSSGCE